MSEKKILTIPNAMSAFRIILIPAIIWSYCVRHDHIQTMLLLLLSGATDMADGWVARRFNMVSDFGKVLDPVADKLTQGALLICLLTEFPLMRGLLVVLIIKEAGMVVTGLLVIRKTGNVYGAQWHGKATTFLLYFTAIVHVIWYSIPDALSTLLILACAVLMVFSFALYVVRNIKLISRSDRSDHSAQGSAS